MDRFSSSSGNFSLKFFIPSAHNYFPQEFIWAKGLLFAFFLMFLFGCASPRSPISSLPRKHRLSGIASWYGHPFHGRRTASGERYNMNAMTAAHRSLPFGTRVRVERVDNDRQVEVRINDRGPFVKGRVIDLSREAARQLGILGVGVVSVRLVPLQKRSNRKPRPIKR